MKVLKRLEDSDNTLNRKKCKFYQSKVFFFGMVFNLELSSFEVDSEVFYVFYFLLNKKWNDETAGDSRGTYHRTVAMKSLNEDLKVLLAVGEALFKSLKAIGDFVSRFR